MEGGSGEGNTSGTGGLADDNGVEGSGHGEHITNEATSGSAHGAGACGGGSFSSSIQHGVQYYETIVTQRDLIIVVNQFMTC